MASIDENRETDQASPEYVAPHLVVIGDLNEIVLGVAGGGDDFMGYSRPDFEFEPDGDS